jgi:hypothetical protein
MSRVVIVIASFLLAISAFTQPITRVAFEPDRPSSHTPILAHIRGYNGSACTASSDVRINGTHIDLNVTCGGAGIAVPMPWAADVFVGVLPAGTYDVAVFAGSPKRTLVVEDADPGFRIIPSEGASGENTTVIIDSPFFAADVVVIGGVGAKQVSYATFVAPPHAPGPVDVTIVTRYDARTVTAKNAFRYYDDPHDPAVFEPLLVPIVYNGAGAFGSQWKTDFSVERKGEAVPVTLPESPHGYLYYVAHDAMPDMAFSARIRDVSRQSQSFGTEIPVVRRDQFRGTPFTFLDIPVDPKYRVTLRVYSLDPYDAPYVNIGAMGRPPHASWAPVMTLPSSPNEPAYAERDLGPLLATYAAPAAGKITVVPASSNGEKLYWAMITITNNETQAVTIIAPR